MRRRLIFSILLILIFTFIATIGYMFVGDYTPLESLYMTVITLSTVGYGEVKELDTAGRIFTIAIIATGVGIVAFIFSSLTSYLTSGHVLDILKGRRMEARLKKLSGHIIIAGYGKLGFELAEELFQAGQEFVIVEDTAKRAQAAIEKGYMVLNEDASNDYTLLKAGVERAKCLITAMTGDSGNAIVTLTARNLNPDMHIVSRGVDDYSEAKLLSAGANEVDLPFKMGSKRMVALALKPTLVEFYDLYMHTYGLDMQEFEIDDNSKCNGKTIADLDFRVNTKGAVIVGIKRRSGGVVLHPGGENKFRSGDTLLLMADEQQMTKVKKILA